MNPDTIHITSIGQAITAALQHQQTGNFRAAEALYRHVLTIAPDNFDALHLLGVLVHQTGDNQQAVQLIEKAVQQYPHNPFACNNLGEIYRTLHQFKEAESCFRKALSLAPDYSQAHNNLGNVLLQRGDTAAAAESYHRATSLNPLYYEAYANLGNALLHLERYDDAAESCRHALQIKPDYAPASNSLGNVLLATSQPIEAESAYRKALALNPDYAEAYNNLAKSLIDQERLDEGLDAYQTAIHLQPAYAEAYYNLGTTFQEIGRMQDAEHAFNQSLRINPGYAACKWNLSLLLLLQGRYEEGFYLYEQRFEGGEKKTFTYLNHLLQQVTSCPRWHGETLADCSLLLIAEQGLGDNLMMMRYVSVLREQKSKKITVYCAQPLARLFAALPGIGEVISMPAPIPTAGFDYHCPTMSLPHLLRTQLTTIPTMVPYLTIPGAVRQKWQTRCADIRKPKIGLVWAAKNVGPKNIPFHQLLPLQTIDEIQLVSLQQGSAAKQFQELGLNVLDWMDECTDLMDSAGLIEQLDLVIAVDTAVAHLAGALGKPVWLLNRYESEWRWMLERSDSPWYPSMRIFRQQSPGKWDDVLSQIIKEVAVCFNLTLPEASNSEFGTLMHEQRLHLALAYLQQCNPQEALPYLTTLAEQLPESPSIWFNLGRAYVMMHQLPQATECYRHALRLKPDNPSIMLCLGKILIQNRAYADAEPYLQQAHTIHPESIEILLLLTTALSKQNKRDDAEQCCRKILAIRPDCTPASYNLAVLQLRRGEYLAGFANFESRLQIEEFKIDSRCYPQPRWDGSPLHGKSILAVGEQGLGDVIQLVRYIPMIADLGGVVTLEVAPALMTLLANFPGVSRLATKSADPPRTDHYVQLLSLPYLFQTTIDTIPSAESYITPDPDKVAIWQQRLANNDSRIKIGVAWQGNRHNPRDHVRSCSLAAVAQLFDLPDATFYSLQVDANTVEDPAFSAVLTPVDVSELLTDLSETAALIANLDLVITVDTAVAHLAGAMGKQTWVLLPVDNDWRWQEDRNDTPWYRSMRLFRQTTPGDWTSVISHIRQKFFRQFNNQIGQLQQGITLLQQGLAMEAERCFAEIIASGQQSAEAFCNRGVALHELQSYHAALDNYRTAIALKPEYLQAYFNMGNTCRSIGQNKAAQACYEQCLTLAADFAPAQLCLGEIHKEQRNFTQAKHYFSAAIKTSPCNADAYQGLAESFQGEENFASAIRTYQQVLTIDPTRNSACNMLGMAYHQLGQMAEAEACYRQALTLAPGKALILNNLGSVLHAQERTDEAIAVYRELLTINPDYAEGHWNLSLALLTVGELIEGWREYEWRFQKVNSVATRAYAQPLWDGSALNGRTILLHSEQGFGDTLQFVRYAPMIAALGGKVIIECQVASLKRLLQSMDGITDVIVEGDPLPLFDCHLPLLSLPLVFKTTITTIPSDVPYLFPSPGDSERWHQHLGGTRACKVGIVWFGRQNQILNRKRSCPLVLFAPIAEVSNCEFYSLQIGEGIEQLAECAFGRQLVNFTADCHDFADTAAFIANLDLVLTIDTAVAHLAGALGVRTWTLLSFGADWRWLQQRQDSPWYPTMRLFRQSIPGDWASVMVTVRNCLHSLCVTLKPSKTSQLQEADSPEKFSEQKRLPFQEIEDYSPPRRLKVGLAWAGRPDNALDYRRTCPFTNLLPLFEFKNISFYSLQIGNNRSAEIAAAPLIDLTGDIGDFEDTAALIANLDLVISIDTSIAHISGALGKETWVLLPYSAEWRWLEHRCDSPWYPTIKLFRQPEHGDWPSVIKKVCESLAELSHTQIPSTCQPDGKTKPFLSNERRELEVSLESYRQKLAISPDSPDALLDVGAALALLGRNDDANSYLRSALARKPDHIGAHLNLAYTLLARGDYGEGWVHYEWRRYRIQPSELPPWPFLEQNVLGKHPQGKSLLVHCEQGFGDTIQFARFLPLLVNAGYHVTVSCQPLLVNLIAQVNSRLHVVGYGEIIPECNLQTLLLSLPYLFNITLESIPATTPYLLPRREKINQWHQRLLPENDP